MANAAPIDFFVHEPTFCFPTTFFNGNALDVIKRYLTEVRRHTTEEVEMRSFVSGSDGNILLMLLVPEHCGFKTIVGQCICKENNLHEWTNAATDLVHKLANAHGWAAVLVF